MSPFASKLLPIFLVTSLGCERRELEITFSEEGRGFSWTERRAVRKSADAAVREARVSLPSLPKQLALVVRLDDDVIPETGETATFALPGQVVWTVDPGRDVLAVIRGQLRPTLLHELHHVVRESATPTRSLIDRVVMEGMATAFERDFGNVSPPWGIAPPEILDWTRELLAQPEDAPRDHWLYRHPDGRRWIGMRVGTFLVDRAAKASGRSSAELVSTSTAEIVRLADVR